MLRLCTLIFQYDIHKNTLKINIIEILISTSFWYLWLYYEFLPSCYLLLQIYHAKSFRMRHAMSLHFNFSECFKKSILLSGPNRTSERPSYLFSLFSAIDSSSNPGVLVLVIDCMSISVSILSRIPNSSKALAPPPPAI